MLRRISHTAPFEKPLSPAAMRLRAVARTGRPRAERGWYDDAVGSRAAAALEVAAVPRPTLLAADDASLVAGVRLGDARARVALVDRFGPYIERLVGGALGVDVDLGDVVNDVFVAVFERIHQVRDPSALRGWIGSLAVFTARGHIRRRRRWRWMRFLAPQDIPDVPAPATTPEQRELLRETYRALEHLPADERIAFGLRFISEMELTEVAGACGVSLATIKRRLARAEAGFRAVAATSEILTERMQRGRRWTST
jgi:RNA polymerase sigma-70 factor, ECF subfamily